MKMSADETNQKEQSLTLTRILTLGFVNAFKLHNKTSNTIKSPFSDYPSNALAISFGSANIKSLNGKTKKPWWPFFYIDCYQFYSSTLEAGQWMVLLHTREKKSAGYLTGDIDSDQASYICTFAHQNDPQEKTPHNQQEDEEEEKCVI